MNKEADKDKAYWAKHLSGPLLAISLQNGAIDISMAKVKKYE